MICTNCLKNTGEEHTVNADGKEVKVVLCPACFEKLYPAQDTDFFSAFVGRTGGSRKRCPSCGTTVEEFRMTGLLGCADCYTAFREEILPTIRYIQGTTRHEGKAPSGAAEANYDVVRDLVREQGTLKAELAKAQEEHDTEAVERLKVRLKEVSKRLSRVE